MLIQSCLACQWSSDNLLFDDGRHWIQGQPKHWLNTQSLGRPILALDPVSSSCVTTSLFCLSRQKQDDHKPKEQYETQ